MSWKRSASSITSWIYCSKAGFSRSGNTASYLRGFGRDYEPKTPTELHADPKCNPGRNHASVERGRVEVATRDLPVHLWLGQTTGSNQSYPTRRSNRTRSQ